MSATALRRGKVAWVRGKLVTSGMQFADGKTQCCVLNRSEDAEKTYSPVGCWYLPVCGVSRVTSRDMMC